MLELHTALVLTEIAFISKAVLGCCLISHRGKLTAHDALKGLFLYTFIVKHLLPLQRTVLQVWLQIVHATLVELHVAHRLTSNGVLTAADVLRVW